MDQTNWTLFKCVAVFMSQPTIFQSCREGGSHRFLGITGLWSVWNARSMITWHKPVISFLAYLSRRLTSELIGWDSSQRPSVRPCVRLFTILNMIISTTRKPIPTKFYLKHYLGGERLH